MQHLHKNKYRLTHDLVIPAGTDLTEATAQSGTQTAMEEVAVGDAYVQVTLNIDKAVDEGQLEPVFE